MNLAYFVQESNRIEGISRLPTSEEVYAHDAFLKLELPNAYDVAKLVYALSGGQLRASVGMDVRVGDHYPPPGGPKIRESLQEIMWRVEAKVHPYYIHHQYETLHPFTDGNGRSGRAIWAWQMLHQQENNSFLGIGFLHAFYYQALAFGR